MLKKIVAAASLLAVAVPPPFQVGNAQELATS
jgi:hypothetical protein